MGLKSKLKKVAKKIEHKVVKPIIKVHAKILGPIVTGTTDYEKQKKRFKAGVVIGGAAVLLGPAAIAKTLGGAAVSSLTRRANPQPQSAVDSGFYPADTMVAQPENPTRQMYGSDPKRPPGLLEKIIGGIWRTVVPTRR